MSPDDCDELEAIDVTTADAYLTFFQAFSSEDLNDVSVAELGEVLGAQAQFEAIANIVPPDADTELVFSILWDELTAECDWGASG